MQLLEGRVWFPVRPGRCVLMGPHIFRVHRGLWGQTCYSISSIQPVRNPFLPMRSSLCKVILIEQSHKSGFLFFFYFQISVFPPEIHRESPKLLVKSQPWQWSWVSPDVEPPVSSVSPLLLQSTPLTCHPPKRCGLSAPLAHTQVEDERAPVSSSSSCQTPTPTSSPGFDALPRLLLGGFHPSHVHLPCC